MEMDLKLLQYAVVLAKHRHFGRAAAVLGISQPTLSRNIATLEKQIGMRVFERSRRDVVATPAGDVHLYVCGPGGFMRHVLDSARAQELYDAMGPAREISGGSAANTLAGLSALGAQCAFIGQVAADQLGDVYEHDMKAIGVERFPKPEKVVLSFLPIQGKYIKTMPIHASQKVMKDSKTELKVSLELVINTELKMQLLSYGANVKVLQPKALAEELKQTAKAMVKAYSEA